MSPFLLVSTVPLVASPASFMPGQEGCLQYYTFWPEPIPGFSCSFSFRLNICYIIWVPDCRSFSEVAVSNGEEVKDNIQLNGTEGTGDAVPGDYGVLQAMSRGRGPKAE